ncbi:SURF1 family protein [Nesterenkonia cremea]|uniref:SURF1-like protein n=1 Tax=Nesterenkonia cremea TaxID=1882340 RepID=A0A917EQG5_9MICC|nr:SURF1 family cytochrome oxidase biogenesis protein [Nesterenkonia cremea]GGE66043.1 SURF1-like protein [Nesterenkonia cremea]
MLKTALQPKWIAMLVLALVLATVFVVMSAWQFGESRTEGNPVEHLTEEPVPMTEIYEPERGMTIYEADRIVDISGEFVEDTQIIVDERLQGEEMGYWVVAAFRVDGAPDDEVIPVVRGWVDDLDEVDALPDGEQLEIQGRLLPTEAPGDGPRETPGIFPTLSAAELINIWDEPSYSGFVVAFDTLDAAGEEIGAEAADSPLESVWVGTQPETSDINWQSLFYAVEWAVFAGFAFYLWWRMVKDAHIKELEEQRLDREWEEQWRREQLAKLQASRQGGAAEGVSSGGSAAEPDAGSHTTDPDTSGPGTTDPDNRDPKDTSS